LGKASVSYRPAHITKKSCRHVISLLFNHLDSKGNYSATSNNTKLVHWPLMGEMFWYSEEGTGWAAAVPNVTTHPSTVSVPITLLSYDGPLLCGFNVAIKGLTFTHIKYYKKLSWC